MAVCGDAGGEVEGVQAVRHLGYRGEEGRVSLALDWSSSHESRENEGRGDGDDFHGDERFRDFAGLRYGFRGLLSVLLYQYALR